MLGGVQTYFSCLQLMVFPPSLPPFLGVVWPIKLLENISLFHQVLPIRFCVMFIIRHLITPFIYKQQVNYRYKITVSF